MRDKRLRRCPCCGSDIVQTENKYNKYSVVCRSCGIRTGRHEYEREAIMCWNWRDADCGYPELPPELSAIAPDGRVRKMQPPIIKNGRIYALKPETVNRGIEIKIGGYKETVPIIRRLYTARNSGYVYIITDGEAVKIGMTKDLPSRASSVQTGNPREIVVLQVIQTRYMSAVEDSLHYYYREHHIRGEWFDLLPLFGEVPA